MVLVFAVTFNLYRCAYMKHFPFLFDKVFLTKIFKKINDQRSETILLNCFWSIIHCYKCIMRYNDLRMEMMYTLFEVKTRGGKLMLN